MADKGGFLREQIFALLSESTTCVEEDLEAVAECEAHIRNRMIVEAIARECGLSLAGFLGNDSLESSYDIKGLRHDRVTSRWSLERVEGEQT